MPDDFESLGLKGGLWSGRLMRTHAPARVMLVHGGEVLEHARLRPDGDGWRVEVTLPSQALSEGVQSFALVADGAGEGPPAADAERLAVLPVLAGAALNQDIMAEIELIRAELDMLKRELRRLASG
ncbi:MAG: hypothetical protein Q4G25_07655 [Paracoccus sp. (in: a-proteobacteria)]|nr:hypothetical protein [Paracoccus sp. (in: a-proteobacteria)]